MFNKNRPFLLVLSLVLFQIAVAQNNTNSPYTRFGYGELIDANSAEQRAMGGTGIGSRNSSSINAMNPASYSAVDSMTFMFDVGLTGLISRFSDPTGKTSKLNSNLEYLNLQFPVSKWLGFSAGLLPYSFSGYNFSRNDSVQVQSNSSTTGYEHYSELYSGAGGISQVYAGLGAKLFNHVSLGVNAYYMFGDIINSRGLTFANLDPSTQVNSIVVRNFRFRYGVQFFNTFAKKHTVTLGFIYENKAPFNGKFMQTHFAIPADTLVYEKDFELPMTYGIGLNYNFDNKLTVGFDYSFQQWGDVLYFGKTDSLVNRSKLAIGAEYIPNPRGNKYLERVRYRAGLNLHDPYYKLAGSAPVKNFGISFGVGLPLKTSSTVVNAAFEYGRVGEKSVFREDYFKITFNATFNESWFFKRKL
jgi:opacity protein-like surface antigen